LLRNAVELPPLEKGGLGGFDFYAPAAKLVVELDGAQHWEIGQAKYDAQRTKGISSRKD
jgi:very-short-patch-repair endonuclease